MSSVQAYVSIPTQNGILSATPNAETILQSLGPVTIGPGAGPILIRGAVQVIAGTGAATVGVRVYYYISSIIGAGLDPQYFSLTVTGGNRYIIPFTYVAPTPPSVQDTLQFALRGTQTGAVTGTGNVVGGHMTIEA